MWGYGLVQPGQEGGLPLRADLRARSVLVRRVSAVRPRSADSAPGAVRSSPYAGWSRHRCMATRHTCPILGGG